MGITVEIEVDVYPTEDPEKIKDAILKLFPDAKLTLLPGKIRGIVYNLDEFGKILREERIRDAARAVFLSSLKNNEIYFELNKQAATKGKISFAVGKVPLGSIKIRIKGDGLLSLIDEIAPDTRKAQ